MEGFFWGAIRWAGRGVAAVLYASTLMQVAGYPGDLPTWLAWLAPYYDRFLSHLHQKGSLLILLAIATALLIPDFIRVFNRGKKRTEEQAAPRTADTDSLYLGSLTHDGVLWKFSHREEACGFDVQGPLCPKDGSLLGFQRGASATRTFPAKETDAVDRVSILYCPECTDTYDLGVGKGTAFTFRSIKESLQDALNRFCVLHPEHRSPRGGSRAA